MRHRAGIFGELGAAHNTHVIDAVNGTRAEIGAELLIAEHRQSLFQAELEPVAAGYAVAGPVMEIFVTDDRFNAEVIFIGRGFCLGQHIFGVKDVKAFVLHRAHIEEINRYDHKDVEVILQTEALLVPLHTVLQ